MERKSPEVKGEAGQEWWFAGRQKCHFWFHGSHRHIAFLITAPQAPFIPQPRSMPGHAGRTSTVCNNILIFWGQLPAFLHSVGKSGSESHRNGFKVGREEIGGQVCLRAGSTHSCPVPAGRGGHRTRALVILPLGP